MQAGMADNKIIKLADGLGDEINARFKDSTTKEFLNTVVTTDKVDYTKDLGVVLPKPVVKFTIVKDETTFRELYMA